MQILRRRNFFTRLPVKLAMLILLAGCESPGSYDDRVGHELPGGRRAPIGPDEMIRTDAYTYAPGATVHLRLTNRTGRAVSYNLCRSQVQRRTGDDWTAIQQSLREVCTAELRGLGPGQSATFSFPLPPIVRSGPFRIRTVLTDARGGQPVEAVSNAFESNRERND